MNNALFRENFENKTELIRKVYEANPIATNKQIAQEVWDRWKVKVASNLIISAIGKYRARRLLQPAFKNLLALSQAHLESFLGDVEQAVWYLRQAARQ